MRFVSWCIFQSIGNTGRKLQLHEVQTIPTKLFEGISGGQLDEEDGIAELIFNVRQHVDTYILPLPAAWKAEAPEDRAGSRAQCCEAPAAHEGGARQCPNKDFDLPYLFIGIMYGCLRKLLTN